jgi:hypothetical protein
MVAASLPFTALEPHQKRVVCSVTCTWLGKGQDKEMLAVTVVRMGIFSLGAEDMELMRQRTLRNLSFNQKSFLSSEEERCHC